MATARSDRSPAICRAAVSLKFLLVLISGAIHQTGVLSQAANGFDYPIGIPNAAGWYNAQDFGDNNHLGEDWNSEQCPLCDIGQPVFAVAHGTVRFARDTQNNAWRGVVIVDHAAPPGSSFVVPGTGGVQQSVASMYAHLDVTVINAWVSEGQTVSRGQQIGIIGPTPEKSTGPHLHFEIRTDLSIMLGPGYSSNNAGWVDPSDFLDANRILQSQQAPGPPWISAAVSGNTVALTWGPGLGGTPDRYHVGVGSMAFASDVFSQNVGTNTSGSGNLPSGTYYARVTASNSAGAADSNEIAIEVGASLAPPGPPTDLRGTVSGTTVSLAWIAPKWGGTPTTYLIEAGTSPGAGNLAHFLTGNVSTTFATTNVPPGIYYTRVRAQNLAGTSTWSNEIVIEVRASLAPPGPPTDLRGTVSGTTVSLAWIAPQEGGTPTTYLIEAGTSPGAGNLARFLTGNVSTTFATTNVPPGIYYTRVRAQNLAGTSGPSNETIFAVETLASHGSDLRIAIRPNPAPAEPIGAFGSPSWRLFFDFLNAGNQGFTGHRVTLIGLDQFGGESRRFDWSPGFTPFRVELGTCGSFLYSERIGPGQTACFGSFSWGQSGPGSLKYILEGFDDDGGAKVYSATVKLDVSPPGMDNHADLGNPSDEVNHNLRGWHSVNPGLLPLGIDNDRTSRYQRLRSSNDVDLGVGQRGIPYILTMRTEDGGCDDSFEIYINDVGPLYRYRHRTSSSAFPLHTVLVDGWIISNERVKVTIRNIASDSCGLAAVYFIRLDPS